GRVLREAAVGRRPSDIALIGQMPYVSCEDGQEVLAVDPDTLAVRQRGPMQEAAHEVVRRLQERRVSEAEAAFLLGGRGVRTVRARAAYQEGVFFAPQRPRNEVPATQVAQGWVFTNALSFVVNVPARVALLDEPQHGYADPSDLVLTPDGRHLF